MCDMVTLLFISKQSAAIAIFHNFFNYFINIMAEDFWTLNRIGIKHKFILQPHLPLIKVGRATDQHLQCKGILLFSKFCLKIV